MFIDSYIYLALYWADVKIKPVALILIICIVVCGVVLGYGDEFVMDKGGQSPDVFPHQISQWDSTILLKINPGILSPILNPIFKLVTFLGSTLAVAIFAALLYVAGYRREGILILATVIIGTLVLAPLKIAIHRPRPYLTLQEVVPLERETGMSFPSGHAERAFALASVLSNSSVKRLVLYSYAILIAFSRIYIGVHYPLDVIAGGFIGWVVGQITLRMESRIFSLVGKLRIGC